MIKDNLANLKKEYVKVRNKYKLPEFNMLNNEFEIEKLADKKTGFLLRGIRRSIERRTENFLKMLEEFVNPTYASHASLTLLKSFTNKDRKNIEDSYKSLVSLMLKAITLEIDFDEKKEAAFIKESVKIWDVTKKDLHELMKSAEHIWKKKIEDEKIDFKYFG